MLYFHQRIKFMDWKEYQYITAELLERAERIGKIDKNVLLPDKSSGRKRQIDALLEVKTKGRIIKIVIDAKYRKRKININDVGIVSELIDAVGADRGVIICPNGWSSYAKDRSKELGLDLKLVTIEDAIEFFNPGKGIFPRVCVCNLFFSDVPIPAADINHTHTPLIPKWVSQPSSKKALSAYSKKAFDTNVKKIAKVMDIVKSITGQYYFVVVMNNPFMQKPPVKRLWLYA